MNTMNYKEIKKPYLFYWFVDAQQGEERAGGRYENYHIIYEVNKDKAFEEYIKWYNANEDSVSIDSFRKINDNCWRYYFSVYCLELPYDVYNWEQFEPLQLLNKF